MYNEISDVDFVTRYCAPRTIMNNVIIHTAFEFRYKEEYLSVNVLPSNYDLEAGLAYVQSTLKPDTLHVKPNGRFVIFNVGTKRLHT